MSPQRKCKTVKRPSRKKQPTGEGELLKAYEFKGQTQHRDIARFGQDKSYVPLSFLEAEQFISIIIREKFDYTKWQRQYFDEIPPGKFHQEALEYAKAHPYSGTAEKL